MKTIRTLFVFVLLLAVSALAYFIYIDSSSMPEFLRQNPLIADLIEENQQETKRESGSNPVAENREPDAASPIAQKLDSPKETQVTWQGRVPVVPGDEQFQRVHVKDATLYYEDGSEVNLWGVNMQSSMYGEYQRYEATIGKKMRPNNKLDMELWKQITLDTFDELELMGVEVIRTHLSAADFTDNDGNLAETPWLDMLCFTLAECHKRGIYVYFTFFNHWGSYNPKSPFSHNKDHKWEYMAVPEKVEMAGRFIRQLVNYKNPYDHNRALKHNPAWIIAEIMNEPTFEVERPDPEQFTEGAAAYEDWLSSHRLPDTEEVWKQYRYESMKSFMNAMDRVLAEENVPAVSCWNLSWVKAIKGQGPEMFKAALDSTIPVFSFSAYPGQWAEKKNKQQHDVNHLWYLKTILKDFHGWLTSPEFKQKKARIVYEYETWHTQSTFTYPAMAKYFRSQGVQIACMWTYNMTGMGEYMGKSRSHNLSVVTTPRKAASFMVAGKAFKETPRYIPFETTEKDADAFGNTALSHPRDLSAYGDDAYLIHTGDVDPDFINIPENPQNIIGHGSSPLVNYEGKGLYFLSKTDDGKWALKVMPHAEFTHAEDPYLKQYDKKNWGNRPLGVKLDETTAFPMTLSLPGLSQSNVVLQVKDGATTPVKATFNAGALSFTVAPGDYIIQ